MSALSRGLLSGLAGGTAALDKRIQEDHTAERDFNYKMTLEEFAAAKRMEQERIREAYSRDIADQSAALEVSEGDKDRASRERIAGIQADAASGRTSKLTAGDKNAIFATVGLKASTIFPDLIGDEKASMFLSNPEKIRPTDVTHVTTQLQKKINEGGEDAAKAEELLPQILKFNNLANASALDVLRWQEETLSVIDSLGDKENDPLEIRP